MDNTNHVDTKWPNQEPTDRQLQIARDRYELTDRELQILREVCLGQSNRETAAKLKIGEHTLKDGMLRIFDKIGVSNRVELLWKILNVDKLP